MFSRKLILLLIAFLALSLFCLSCTHHLVPSLQRVNSTRIPDISTNQKIRLENTQSSTETILFYSHGWIHEHKVIELLRLELEQKGAILSDKAEKVLKLSVKKAGFDQGQFRKRAYLTLQVETGNGYNVEIPAQNLTPAVPDRAMGGAITLALTDMFNDQKILEYIK